MLRYVQRLFCSKSELRILRVADRCLCAQSSSARAVIFTSAMSQNDCGEHFGKCVYERLKPRIDFSFRRLT